MKSENPTSRDIAQIAGVSQATVSRALRNSPLVRKETREHVQKVARDLHYFVNRNAAGLRTQESKTIALLLFDEIDGTDKKMNLFFWAMLDNITRSAARRGYDVLVSLQQLTADWHIEYQASHRADGLILLGYGDYTEYREKLNALAAAHTRFMIWGPIINDQPGHSFGCDNESGGYQATRHLLSLGRKNVAYLGRKVLRSPEHAARYTGYVAALREAGITPNVTLQVPADNSEAMGYQAVRQLLQKGALFDAIFAGTDLIAIGAMRALADNGISVPQSVSVVGFDDMPLAAYVSPALTTVQQNAQAGAEGLVEGIVGLIKGRPVESKLMAPKLIIRQSCGALATRCGP
ncbi:MAG: LacI family transcriptional regulator [Gammaproteobacteria bacterium]|nr:LacI family transcriptional regulator [Gammaproteobacteria bacterium]MDH4313784.1 LacI family transcriptional regulator [Gammaproteobacteria bacterium]MDH5214796.1 LacI family transcriptional regulator [Gammaproteobacteria bacterium]MDH5500043.1 LacI family transcriptional regulator [Gammaproteobacteria bacterium]